MKTKEMGDKLMEDISPILASFQSTVPFRQREEHQQRDSV